MYHFIQGSREIFVGPVDIGLSPDASLKVRFDDQLQQISEPDRESVKKLLLRVFPKTNSLIGGAYYGSDWLSGWRKNLRICTTEHFDVYFRLSLRQYQISRAELQSILEHIDDSEAFGQILVDLAHRKQKGDLSKLSYFLNSLSDHADADIPEDAIPSIISTFFWVGDDLLCAEDDVPRFLFYSTDGLIFRVISKLVGRLDEAKRFSLLEDAIRKGNSVSLTAKLITIYGRQHGKYDAKGKPDEEQILNPEHLAKLEKLTLEKIRQASLDGSLIGAPLLGRVLYFWEQNEDNEKVRSWIEETIRDDEKLVLFLDRFISVSSTQSIDDVIPKQHWILASEGLSAFINLDELKGRVQSLLESEIVLTERQREALTNFVRKVEEPL